jgi:dsDNA-specific endonuclease/ATPase MutS2
LDERIADLNRRIDQLSAYIDERKDLAPDDLVKLLNLHGQLTSRIGRLMRDRQQVSEDADELTVAIHAALDDLSEKWGVEL